VGQLVGAVLVVEDPPWSDVTDPVFVTDLFVLPARRRRCRGLEAVHGSTRFSNQWWAYGSLLKASTSW
jgi:hypothetical protein